jgi:hypothetical protein
MYDGLLPTSFCNVKNAYGVFLLYNPGDPHTYVLAGRLDSLVKEQVAGDALDDKSKKRGLELVVAAIKTDGGTKPKIREHSDGNKGRTTGIDTRWLDYFRDVTAN